MIVLQSTGVAAQDDVRPSEDAVATTPTVPVNGEGLGVVPAKVWEEAFGERVVLTRKGGEVVSGRLIEVGFAAVKIARPQGCSIVEVPRRDVASVQIPIWPVPSYLVGRTLAVALLGGARRVGRLEEVRPREVLLTPLGGRNGSVRISRTHLAGLELPPARGRRIALEVGGSAVDDAKRADCLSTVAALGGIIDETAPIRVAVSFLAASETSRDQPLPGMAPCDHRLGLPGPNGVAARETIPQRPEVPGRFTVTSSTRGLLQTSQQTTETVDELCWAAYAAGTVALAAGQRSQGLDPSGGLGAEAAPARSNVRFRVAAGSTRTTPVRIDARPCTLPCELEILGPRQTDTELEISGDDFSLRITRPVPGSVVTLRFPGSADRRVGVWAMGLSPALFLAGVALFVDSGFRAPGAGYVGGVWHDSDKLLGAVAEEIAGLSVMVAAVGMTIFGWVRYTRRKPDEVVSPPGAVRRASHLRLRLTSAALAPFGGGAAVGAGFSF